VEGTSKAVAEPAAAFVSSHGMLSAVRVLVTVNDAFGHVFPLVPTTLRLPPPATKFY